MPRKKLSISKVHEKELKALITNAANCRPESERSDSSISYSAKHQKHQELLRFAIQSLGLKINSNKVKDITAVGNFFKIEKDELPPLKMSETQKILRDISDESNLYIAIKDLRSETAEIVDMLLDPTGGNLGDWSRNINLAQKRWKRASANLDSSLPNEERIEEDLNSFAKLWEDLNLYKNSETAALIQ